MNLRAHLLVILKNKMRPLTSGATNDTLNELESIISRYYVSKEELKNEIERMKNCTGYLAGETDCLDDLSHALLEDRAISNK